MAHIMVSEKWRSEPLNPPDMGQHYIIKGSWEAISELRMTFYLVQLTMMKGGRSCNNT